MDDLFGGVSNNDAFPKCLCFCWGMCQEPSCVAEERFAVAARERRDVAVENDVMRSTGNECAGPMKRDVVVGVEIIPRVCFYAQVVNCSEFPLQYRAELFTKSRECISLERRKSTHNYNSMGFNLVFQVRGGDCGD